MLIFNERTGFYLSNTGLFSPRVKIIRNYMFCQAKQYNSNISVKCLHSFGIFLRVVPENTEPVLTAKQNMLVFHSIQSESLFYRIDEPAIVYDEYFDLNSTLSFVYRVVFRGPTILFTINELISKMSLPLFRTPTANAILTIDFELLITISVRECFFFVLKLLTFL